MCAGAFGGQTESVNLSLTAIGEDSCWPISQSASQPISQSDSCVFVLWVAPLRTVETTTRDGAILPLGSRIAQECCGPCATHLQTQTRTETRGQGLRTMCRVGHRCTPCGQPCCSSFEASPQTSGRRCVRGGGYLTMVALPWLPCHGCLHETVSPTYAYTTIRTVVEDLLALLLEVFIIVRCAVDVTGVLLLCRQLGYGNRAKVVFEGVGKAGSNAPSGSACSDIAVNDAFCSRNAFAIFHP